MHPTYITHRWKLKENQCNGPQIDVLLCMSRLRISTVSQGRRWERETCWWSWNRTPLKCDLSTGISLNLSTSSQEYPHWQTDWILFLPVALCVSSRHSKVDGLDGDSQLSCIRSGFSTCLPPLLLVSLCSHLKGKKTFFYFLLNLIVSLWFKIVK